MGKVSPALMSPLRAHAKTELHVALSAGATILRPGTLPVPAAANASRSHGIRSVTIHTRGNKVNEHEFRLQNLQPVAEYLLRPARRVCHRALRQY